MKDDPNAKQLAKGKVKKTVRSRKTSRTEVERIKHEDLRAGQDADLMTMVVKEMLMEPVLVPRIC